MKRRRPGIHYREEELVTRFPASALIVVLGAGPCLYGQTRIASSDGRNPAHPPDTRPGTLPCGYLASNCIPPAPPRHHDDTGRNIAIGAGLELLLGVTIAGLAHNSSAGASGAFKEAFKRVGQPVPKGYGVLEVVPDPRSEQSPGPECQVSLLVGFTSTAAASPDRTVLLYPPQPGESSDSNSVRTIHLQSSSELSLRFSANSANGQLGPGCRSLLIMQQDPESFKVLLGMDWQWTFIAEPNFDIRITFSPDLWTGEGELEFGQELESLALEKIQQRRLAILPVGGSGAIESRERVGDPVMTANSLKLGPDFLEVGLEGRLGIPIREALAAWQWGAGFAALDLPLLFWSISGLRRRDRMFLSYSREDESRVMEIYDMLAQAGGKPWIDRKNIPGGARWRALIERQMRRSSQTLVFLSDHSVKTGGYFWLEMEIAVSLAERRRGDAFVIPVKLEECRLPDVLMPYNALSLFEPGGRERLLTALGLPASTSALA
jgi:hypothetical protein